MFFLPEMLKRRLNRVYHFDRLEKEDGSRQEARSYVISVSPCTGCYRHIRISAGSSFLQLHKAILDSFDMEDRASHAFFMDNAKWSGRDCYYKEGIESHYRPTKKYRLTQASLYKGMKFKYIYDFHQELVFQCRVLQVLAEDTGTPAVVRSKGEWYPCEDGE